MTVWLTHLSWSHAATLLIMAVIAFAAIRTLIKHWHRTRREPALFVPYPQIDRAYTHGQFQILDTMKDKKGVTR